MRCPFFSPFFLPLFFLLLFHPRRTAERTMRGVLPRLPAFSYQLESLPGEIDLAFPNIDAPGVYLRRPLSPLCRWYLAGVLSGFDQLEQRAGVVSCSLESCCFRPCAASHLLWLLLFFFVCVFFFFLFFPQIGGFLAPPMRPANHDASSPQPRAPGAVEHDERRLTIAVQ